MSRIKNIEFIDIINKLPEIISLNCEKEFNQQKYDIFLCALGFEERCLTIPEQLSNTKDFKCKQTIYFDYSTNIKDNEINKQKLILALQQFSDSQKSMQCDEDYFTRNLREYLNLFNKTNQKLKVIFDISVCSSKLLLTVMKVLFEFEINLQVLYSEAKIYHPTWEEFEKEHLKWITEDDFGIARGVGKVMPSPEYPGSNRQNPDLIIAFLTFKQERTHAIIADIDETILIKPEKRIKWIIGDPHMDDEYKIKRKDIMKKVNKIPEACPTYEVSTFNYKETLKKLDKIYNDNNLDFHINISALGSKMQTLGIALFCYVRPDVSVYLAIPKEYNSKQYSEGCKATWKIDFGNLLEIRNILDKVDQFELLQIDKKCN
jgi:hypothetical protein